MHKKKTSRLDLPPLVTGRATPHVVRTTPRASSPARPSIQPCARRLFAILALLLLASVARGATTTYEVLLDLDLNAQTGCTISTPKGSVGGIEQALVTTVVTGTGGGSVAGVARRVCTAAVLGAPLPVDAGGWPVGFGNGTLGSTVIETYVPRAALGPATSAAAAVRVSGDGGAGDAIVGPEGGSLPIVSFASPGSATPQVIPLLSPWALLLLALLLGVLAARTVRRGDALGMLFAVVLGSAVGALVWAATVILDGNVGDWSGVQPSATDAMGNAQPNGDLVALFTQSDQQRVYFRIDADLRPEVPGVLLQGAADEFALAALTSLAPVAAETGDIVNGVILTRLDAAFDAEATVGQVNAALSAINGRIAGMQPGQPFLVVAVPRQADLLALDALADDFQSRPGILLAVSGREAVANLAPPPPANGTLVMDHLNDARFPAAWNTKALQGDCADPVTVVVADFFRRPVPDSSVYQDFDKEVPGVQFLGSTGEPPAGFQYHGYEMLGTLAAAIDDAVPTGANPFPGCLTIKAVNVAGLTYEAENLAIQQAIPASGKTVVNTSLGFDTCGDPCTPANLRIARAVDRALTGAHMRWLARELEDRLLLTTSAGNEHEKPVGAIYPGARLAPWNYATTVASRADADFSFATNAQLWEPTVACPPGPCFPSLTMEPQDRPRLDDLLSQLALRGADAPGNILIVGAVDPNQNLRADYSEVGADLAAVGTVPMMEPDEFDAGTSVAAPQVAGLASYLWRISPELRNGPVADTIGAILANTRGAGSVIDAYATVLSLDPVGAPDPATWDVRRTVLDVDNDGGFDEGDLQLYVERFYEAPAYVDEVNPAERDYSVHDLNGDGYTGGNRRESFDLDRTGSSRFGMPTLTTLQLEVGTERLELNENNATDLDILCWYAWSPLYEGDPDAREEILANRCFTIAVTVGPATANVQPGGTVQFAADVSGTDNPEVDWALPDGGGSIDADGLFTAGNETGTFTVRAISEVDPNAFGDATVAVAGVSGQLTVLSRESRVKAAAGGCVGTQEQGCVIQGDSEDISSLPSDYGDFNHDLGGKSFTQTGTGIYAGNSASATASARQSTNLTFGASSLVVNALALSASGTAEVVQGPLRSAGADYSALSSLLVRFRIVGSALPYQIDGSVSGDPPQGGAGGAIAALYRIDPPYTSVERFENNPGFDSSGTLAPGFYEFHISASCTYSEGSSTSTSTCATTGSAHLVVGQ